MVPLFLVKQSSHHEQLTVRELFPGCSLNRSDTPVVVFRQALMPHANEPVLFARAVVMSPELEKAISK